MASYHSPEQPTTDQEPSSERALRSARRNSRGSEENSRGSEENSRGSEPPPSPAQGPRVPNPEDSSHGYHLTISHPEQTVFHCPVADCGVSFNIFSSLTRHFRKHQGLTVKLDFKCSDCGEKFETRRSVSCHHIARHPREGSRRAARVGDHVCEFCGEGFISGRSLSQHVRGSHAAEKSRKLASMQEQGSRYWKPEEHKRFLEALRRFGSSSNIKIANFVGNKSAAQVNSHKFKFLKQHPNWKEELGDLDAANSPSQPDPEPRSEPLASGSSSPSQPDPEPRGEPRASGSSSPSQPDPEPRGEPRASGSSSPSQPDPEPAQQPQSSPQRIPTVNLSSALELHPGALLQAPLATPTPTGDEAGLIQAGSGSPITPTGSPQSRVSTPPSCSHSTGDPDSPPSSLVTRAAALVEQLRRPLSQDGGSHLEPSDNPDEDQATTSSGHVPQSQDPVRVTGSQIGHLLWSIRDQVTESNPPVESAPHTTPSQPSSLGPNIQLQPREQSPPPVEQNLSPPVEQHQQPPNPQTQELPPTASQPPRQPPPSASQPPRQPPQDQQEANVARNWREGWLKDLQPFMNKELSIEEWANFESTLDRWILKVAKKPRSVPRNNTTWWKKRQHRRKQPSTQSSRQPSSSQPPNSQNRHGTGTTDIRENANPQQQHHRLGGRQRRIEQAKRLQGFYRGNPKKCIRSLLTNEQSKQCTIPMEQLEAHFRSSYSNPVNITDPAPQWLHQDDREEDVMDHSIQPSEVKAQLRRLPTKSSPGPDKVGYGSWKWLDWNGELLATIFEICRRSRKIPQLWKNNTMILIHKKGDENVISNWRPISLQNTIYKVYAAIIARRLANWALETGALSPSQKGFLPFEGCFEHSFLLQSALMDARRHKKGITVVWLDLKDAFGSVPHSVLEEMLKRAGLRGNILDIVNDIYNDANCQLKTGPQIGNPFPFRKGVKQGCPLSPILFNFAIEGLLRGVESLNSSPDLGYSLGDVNLRVLAYADDLCVLGHSKDGVQKILDRINEFTSWANLTFNINKCCSLTMAYRASKIFAEPFQPLLGGESIPDLPWENRYRYLGADFGANPRAALEDVKSSYIKDCTTILQSLLTDWQKLDAIKRFLKPRLDFHLRTLLPERKWAQQIDRRVREIVKQELRLPRRTISAFLYCDLQDGGLGLPNIEDEMDAAFVSQAFKFLANEGDVRVSKVAKHQLGEVAKKRLNCEDTNPEVLCQFINTPPVPGEGNRGDLRSLWSLVRRSLHTIGARILVEDSVTLAVDDKPLTWNSRKHSSRFLKHQCRKKHLQTVLNAKDQGRSFPEIHKHQASNHWISTGRYVSFSEYRFALKSRLNLLPVRTVQKRFRPAVTDTRCRKCVQHPETLSHVLNHCPSNMGLIRQRHSHILARLTRAIPDHLGNKFVEQEVPGDPERNKPDLVVVSQDQKSAFIIDVTLPFEGEESMMNARSRKLEKYASLKQWMLEEKGFEAVYLDAFIVGSLGSWDPENEEVLKKLKVNYNYAKLFRKLCVCSALSGSYDIWRAHSHPP